jgi:hypothetical protein
MEEDRQTRRVTIRLTPYQARRLWKLRTADLPEGARPRTVTEVLVRALLDASRTLDRDEPSVHREESAAARSIDSTHHEHDLAVHDERAQRPDNGAAPASANIDGAEVPSAMMAVDAQEAGHQ